MKLDEIFCELKEEYTYIFRLIHFTIWNEWKEPLSSFEPPSPFQKHGNYNISPNKKEITKCQNYYEFEAYFDDIKKAMEWKKKDRKKFLKELNNVFKNPQVKIIDLDYEKIKCIPIMVCIDDTQDKTMKSVVIQFYHKFWDLFI